MEKKMWSILGAVAIIMFLLGTLMMWLLRPSSTVVVKPQDMQEARMEQYRADSAKYYRIINAMSLDRQRIDSMYAKSEKNNEILWKKLAAALDAIKSMPPDSINILFARYTEDSPCR